MISRSCTPGSVTGVARASQPLAYDWRVEARSAPRVPLEAGIGPDNPPCPACGEPLFAWAVMPASRSPVRRCEACGLGVAGEPGDPDDAREDLRRLLADGRVPNRAGLAAWLGGSGWAGIGPGSRYLHTPRSAARLGLAAGRPRFAFALMWQTLLNSLTFGHDVALAGLGKADAVPARRSWQGRLDAVVSVLAAPVVAIFAGLLETAAWIAGRGGAFGTS